MRPAVTSPADQDLQDAIQALLNAARTAIRASSLVGHLAPDAVALRWQLVLSAWTALGAVEARLPEGVAWSFWRASLKILAGRLLEEASDLPPQMAKAPGPT